MITPELLRKSGLVAPYIKDAGDRVRDIVLSMCEASGFAYVGRFKEADSLAEKIETGRLKSWSDLDDLFACSIVIPTLSSEAAVLSFLESRFVLVECRRRAESSKDPAVFRFDATRFSGRLLPTSVPSASQELLGVRFEVQIRTAFEHAWSVTTHALAYKGGQVEWRHLRLAAQLRATVEQLDQVVSGFEQTAAFIPEQSWPEVVGKNHIREFLVAHVGRGVIPTESAPASWSRLCDSLHSVIHSHMRPTFSGHVEAIDRALALIAVELDSLGTVPFPRSISLFQFCVGALAKRGLLNRPVPRFTPLLTQELLQLYPDVRQLGAGFDFEF